MNDLVRAIERYFNSSLLNLLCLSDSGPSLAALDDGGS